MYISIDLGGTSTRVASSLDFKKIEDQEKFDTSHDADEQMAKISENIKKVSHAKNIKGVCIGVPGMLDKEKRRFDTIVNVPVLSGLSYREFLGDKYDDSIIVAENDAALAGLAEAVEGAGLHHDCVAYLTLSTGVGGVRICGKQIDPYQKFSEPGHMIIQGGGRYFDKCGQYGCFSSYCSGTAFEYIYGESPVTCKDLDIWKDYAKYLSMGITNILAVWSPDIIVLGGSLSNKFTDFFKEPLLIELHKQELFKVPPIVRSHFGDESGLRGGFVLLSQHLSNGRFIY